jgi:hypothetical protein
MVTIESVRHFSTSQEQGKVNSIGRGKKNKLWSSYTLHG